jgi:hypothetical protein
MRRDLERYYAVLSLVLASVDLSAAEAGLIVDALNGTAITLTTAQLRGGSRASSHPCGHC